MWKISFTSLRAHKMRLVRTCSAVLLGVAFLAGTLVLGDTMRAGFSNVFSDAYAGTDVVVQGAESISNDSGEQRRIVPESLLSTVEGIEGVDVVAPAIDGVAQVIGADGEPVGGSGPPTIGAAWDDTEMNPFTLAEGRAPEAAGEITIDRGTATDGELEVGDRTTVRTPTPVEVTVVGIMEFGDQDSIGGSGYTAFTPEDARQHLIFGEAGYTSISVAASDGVSADELASRIGAVLPEGFEALTGEQMSVAATENIGAEFLDMFEMFLLVFTGVALLVSTFSIYNTFSVILAQRARESALFRAIGATRGQVLGSIALESVVVGLTVTLLASLAPAIRASAIPPLAALRDSAIDRSGGARVRAVLGAVVSAAGAGLVLLGALGDLDSPLNVVGPGAVLCLVGLVVLGPVVARPAARLLGAPVARLRGASGGLARGNAMRNPRRTAGTASALMIGVSVVALFTVVAASLTTMVRDTVAGSITSELVMVEDGFSGTGMSPDLTTALAELPEVDHAVGLGFGTAVVDGEETDFTLAETSLLDNVIDTEVVEGSFAELTADQIAVSSAAAEDNGWSIGSTVQTTFIDGATVPLSVGAIYERSELTGPMVMPSERWSAHNTFDVNFVNLIDLAPGVGVEQGRTAVDEVGEPFGAPSTQTSAEYADDVAGQITQLLSIVYVLLALSIVIALMGIANTLALSIHERTRELGLLRAIGQTRSQLRSMVRWESVIIAVFGTVGGIGLGLFLAWGLVSGLAADMDGSTFSAPVAQLVVITAVGGAAGVLAGILPARRAARLDVLGAIAEE